MSIFTTILSASHGVFLTGSIESSRTDGSADVRLIRDSTNIVDGNKLGKISFLAYDGTPGGLPLSGAFIEAKAVNSWSTQYRQATDLRIGVQTHENNIDRTLTPAMVVSGSDASVGFEVGIRPARVQVGVATDNNLADHGDGLLRVSSKLNDTGIDIDPDSGTGKYGFIRFYNNSSFSSQTPAIFVESNPANPNDKFNIGRWDNSGNHVSAIAVHNNANSVRIGGGGFSNANDTAAALVVTSSTDTRKSTLRVASRHETRETANQPGICIDFKAGSGNSTGAWWFASGDDLVRQRTMVPLRITSASPGSNDAASIYSAMTFAQGGAETRVGIGGGNSAWPSTPFPRSMDPTGSLHIESTNNQTLELTSTLEKSLLLLGNSRNSTNREYAELSFDVSTDFDIEKRTAAITVVRDEDNADSTIHKGRMHFRLDDGSGNKDSTRTRMRIDDQGGFLILSGTHLGGGTGYPNVRDNYMEVGNQVPSGAMTLITHGGLINAKPSSIPTLNFMLYTGTTDSDTSREVRVDDELGRLQWWSNDSELTTQSEKVSAYISVTAPINHSGIAKSPGVMSFYVRNNGDAHPYKALELADNVTITSNASNSDIILNAADDIILSPAGERIQMTDGSTTRFSFRTDSTPEIDVVGVFKIDGNDTVEIESGATHDITLDAGGDIILSADGDQIIMNDGSTTRFTFNVDSTPQIDAVGALTIASTDDMTLTTPGGSAILSSVGHFTGSFIKATGASTTGAQLTLKNGLNLQEQNLDIMGRYDTINNVGTGDSLGKINFKHYTNSGGQLGTIRAQIDCEAADEEPNNGFSTELKFSTSTDIAAETLVEGLKIGKPFSTYNNFPLLQAQGGLLIGDTAGTNPGVVRIRAKSAVSNTLSALDVSSIYNVTPYDTQKPVAIFTGNTGNTAAQGVVRMHNIDTSSQTGDVILHTRQDDTTPNSSALHFAAFTTTTLVGGYSYTGVVTPFTGRHYTKLDGTDDYRLGTIMKSTGELIYEDEGGSVDNAWVKSTGTTTAKEPGVVGVYSGPCPGAGGFDDAHGYNAIGEGKVLVTDEGGNISIGDYVCSSNRAGHGMKQDDDLLHNYTVAKALTALNWNTVEVDPELGFKSTLIACTYHCG